MNFKKDLAFGKTYEQIAKNYFNNQTSEVTGCFKDYDFICKNTSYEIKADRMAYKTNNVAIEYKCNNKPSGISSTKSKYYIYFIVKPDNTHTAYMIPTDDIKKLIEDNNIIEIYVVVMVTEPKCIYLR